MAKKEGAAAASTEAVAPKKGGKLKIIIVAALGILVLLGAGAGYLLLSPPAQEQEEGEVASKNDGKPPVYVTLAVFTVNLSGREHLLQTELQLAVADAEVQQKIEERMPEVRDILIRLLSSKTVDDLTQPDGKDRLSSEIQQQVNAVLGIKNESEGVRKVLFASFIIQ